MRLFLARRSRFGTVTRCDRGFEDTRIPFCASQRKRRLAGYGAARANRERVHVSVERRERGDFERNGIELLLVARTIAEDSSFLRADHSVWLSSVAHEGDVFLALDDDELGWLKRVAPMVAVRLSPDMNENRVG